MAADLMKPTCPPSVNLAPHPPTHPPTHPATPPPPPHPTPPVPPGRHHLGLGEPFQGDSEARSSYTLHGKAGGALAQSYRREDLARREQCVPLHLKLEHREPEEPAARHLATIHQLSFGA